MLPLNFWRLCRVVENRRRVKIVFYDLVLDFPEDVSTSDSASLTTTWSSNQTLQPILRKNLLKKPKHSARSKVKKQTQRRFIKSDVPSKIKQLKMKQKQLDIFHLRKNLSTSSSTPSEQPHTQEKTASLDESDERKGFCVYTARSQPEGSSISKTKPRKDIQTEKRIESKSQDDIPVERLFLRRPTPWITNLTPAVKKTTSIIQSENELISKIEEGMKSGSEGASTSNEDFFPLGIGFLFPTKVTEALKKLFQPVKLTPKTDIQVSSRTTQRPADQSHYLKKEASKSLSKYIFTNCYFIFINLYLTT